MSSDRFEVYVRYRFQKALEAYDDALILADRGKWNTVVNRLYYSCFYSVIALLIKNEIETSTHDGTRTQFGLNSLKPD
ncbi:MAG: HEPN domain-containing protein [Bacteroidales bacterium]|nr:HEPN domain-containing protein [Bacteroidales bacterium]